MNRVIVGVGEALWDLLPEGKKIGGAPANFAYHLSQFGFDSLVVSAVGKDSNGDEILDIFGKRALETQIKRVDYPTGTVNVTLDEKGVPCYEIKEGVAWDNIPYTKELESIVPSICAICFGSLAQRSKVSRSTINRLLDAMPNNEGVLKIFDINLRQYFYTKEIIEESIKRCNILKINDEELITIKEILDNPQSGTKDLCWALISKYDLKVVILTCGTDGSYIFRSGAVTFFETPKVKIADTVGAGDSFTAAFTAALLNDKPIEWAHKFAVLVSAYLCTQNGAMPILPSQLKELDGEFEIEEVLKKL